MTHLLAGLIGWAVASVVLALLFGYLTRERDGENEAFQPCFASDDHRSTMGTHNFVPRFDNASGAQTYVRDICVDCGEVRERTPNYVSNGPLEDTKQSA